MLFTGSVEESRVVYILFKNAIICFAAKSQLSLGSKNVFQKKLHVLRINARSKDKTIILREL